MTTVVPIFRAPPTAGKSPAAAPQRSAAPAGIPAPVPAAAAAAAAKPAPAGRRVTGKALRAAREALSLDPAFEQAVSLWLAAYIRLLTPAPLL
ncbi:MAG: hypothetical protein WCL16_08210 [bacterium]